MISIAECKRILNNDNHQYTDDEIIEIRDLLYQLAGLEIKNRNQYKYDEECDFILSRK